MLVVSQFVLNNASDINIRSVNIPKAILAWTKSANLNLTCEDLRVLTVTAIFECIFNIAKNFVPKVEVFPRDTLLLINHSDERLNFELFLQALLWLEVDLVVDLNIIVLLYLLMLNGLTVMLEVHFVPGVLLGITFVSWLFNLFIIAVCDVLIVAVIVSILLMRLRFNLIRVAFIVLFFSGPLASNILSLNIRLYAALFFFDWVLR